MMKRLVAVGLVAAVAAFGAARAAVAEVTAATEWQDVPDGAKVGEVVAPVVSNVVTKSYVEGLGIGGGVDTNAVLALVASPTVTNAGAVAAAAAAVTAAGYRPMTNRVWAVGGFGEWTGNAITQIEAEYGTITSSQIVEYEGGFVFEIIFSDEHSILVCKSFGNITFDTYEEAKTATDGYVDDIPSGHYGRVTRTYTSPANLALDTETAAAIAAATNGVATRAEVAAATNAAVATAVATANAHADAATNALPTFAAVTNIVDGMADLAVSSSVTNAVETAFEDMLGANWRTTYGGGLAGIIAALAAAVAWLKRKTAEIETNVGTAADSLTTALGTAATTTEES